MLNLYLLMLEHLLDHNHEVFRGKGNSADLRVRLRKLVAERYPKEDCIPDSIRQLLEEEEAEQEQVI